MAKLASSLGVICIGAGRAAEMVMSEHATAIAHRHGLTMSPFEFLHFLDRAGTSARHADADHHSASDEAADRSAKRDGRCTADEGPDDSPEVIAGDADGRSAARGRQHDASYNSRSSR